MNDPLYLGWRHERVRGAEYDAFVQALMQVFTNVLLQWEDFAKNNARRLLNRYRARLCSFNDDIEGTGAVTLAGLLAASAVTGAPLSDQRIVILGAGSAATGICEQIAAAIVREGRTVDEAKAAIWLADSHGPVHAGRTDLDAGKRTLRPVAGVCSRLSPDSPQRRNASRCSTAGAPDDSDRRSHQAGCFH